MNCCILLMIATMSPAGESTSRPAVVVVVGAPGAAEYQSQFHRWAEHWRQSAERGMAECTLIGRAQGEPPTDKEQLRETLSKQTSDGPEPLWIVLIGHGTFDGREAKFNLRGSDITGKELADLLTRFSRPVAVINCASSSGPFINALSAKNRAIVTATRSGNEQNYARFGEYMAQAIGDPQADLDKDEQVSLLEAFLTASGRVAEFYRTDARLATEHALLDDNGDGLGTPADWFRGVRATKRAKDGAALDGIRAHQLHLVRSDREQRLSPEVRKRRDELELSLAALRDEKDKLSEPEYYNRLEKLLVELARLYLAGDSVGSDKPSAAPSTSPAASSP